MKVEQNFRQGKPIHQKHRVWNKQHVLFVWCLFFYTINIYRVPIRNPALFQGVGDSSLKINHYVLPLWFPKDEFLEVEFLVQRIHLNLQLYKRSYYQTTCGFRVSCGDKRSSWSRNDEVFLVMPAWPWRGSGPEGLGPG